MSNTVDEGIMALQKLILKIKPGTSTPIRSALVALYTADQEGELRFSKLIGIMQLDIDRHYKTHVLRFYDVETLTMVFQVELYYGFYENYKMLTNFFYTFEYPRGIIGLMYRNQDDADIMKLKIKNASPPMKQYEEIKKKKLEDIKKKKKQNSFFGKVKNFFADEEQKPVEHESIVYEVKKQKSISFDLSTGTFNTDKIPPEWQELFDSLNLREEDLQDKQVVGIIVEETIMHQIKNQAEQNPNRELQKKIKQAEEEEKQYYESLRKSKMNNMPPPPPPPPILHPPSLSNNVPERKTGRTNLMDQIRNNNVKLKHVETSQKGINLDLTNMNKEERMDHAERLRMKLQMRKKALNRREASDDESD